MSRRLIPFFLLLAGFALYSGTLSAPFVLDDKMYILGNPRVHSLVNFFDLSGTRSIALLSFALN